MPINLTGGQIKDTYDQLLHLDGGPEAVEKVVYSGTGVPTALKVGTSSVSVGNVQFSGGTITTLGGTLTLTAAAGGPVSMANAAITGGFITGITDLSVADGGTGASDAAGARANLGLGTVATQDADAVSITGGSISGVSFSGTFTGITSITSTSFFTDDAAAGLTLTGNDLLADGTDTNIDIDITPKGTGEVNLPKVDIDAGAIDGTTIGGATPAAGTFTDSLATDSVGFTTGNGGTVTQLTSRTTGVTLNAPSGQITLVSDSMPGLASQEFTLTNSFIAPTDVVLVSFGSGLTSAAYDATVTATAAGSCKIAIHNTNNSATPTDTPVLNFVVFKGVNS